MMAGFIAVHVGAGYHGENFRPLYMKTCREACSEAIQVLNDGYDAVEAVASAVSVLEDCPLTNAGIGSNLTLNGTVECDAGIMDGASLNFGSVGALCNMQNPIKVAKKLLVEQKKGLLSGGRIPPCTLVREGALNWALDHGFSLFDNKNLLTKNSEYAYKKNKNLLEQIASFISKTPTCLCNEEKRTYSENDLLDTVGAICVDSFGNVASAVSSGGLLLKFPGRIGQSPIYGAGCWAENSRENSRPSVACTVTGAGEYLMKTIFAKECSTRLHEKYDCVSALPDVFKEKFLDSIFLKNIDSKLAGVLALKHYAPDNFCEVAWAHNTKTMALGYGSTKARKPVCLVSEQPVNACDDKTIIGSEKLIRLT
ncbi:threonine aspartase 1 [Nephila pilipes]|uniref:Threonine aspartase 1 n=1 Tax=Nephila pilipes TaxID=299642 RepID=A0A8X6QU11_NEPPI|nr:threonine aspartase 1 [Nephila pilipes]